MENNDPTIDQNELRARRFAALFPGSERGHGDFMAEPEGVERGTKVEGPRSTIKRAATLADFRAHLNGTAGLGAVPLLLNPPGTTRWAAIDVDDYGLDLVEFAVRLTRMGIPVIVCRSKSGGAHLYVFFREPVPVTYLRKRLREWAAAIGYPRAEIFPKQDAYGDDASSNSYYGNWINLPYQAGEFTMRYALDNDGSSLTLDQFIVFAETCAMSLEELEGVEIGQDPTVADRQPAHRDDQVVPPELSGAPPCLVSMSALGVSEPGRNQALFTMAIYLHRSDPGNALERARVFAQERTTPPLSHADIVATTRSAGKGYNYRCREHPMAGLCDRPTCLLREFGVGFGRTPLASGASPWRELRFGELIKITTPDPSYTWDINGRRYELTHAEFSDQVRFIDYVHRRLHLVLPEIKRKDWRIFQQSLVAASRLENPPDDATPAGQFRQHLDKFANGRFKAKQLDEITLGRPYTDPETGRIFFQVKHLVGYLREEKVPNMNEQTVYARLQEVGLQTHSNVLKGKIQPYWSIDSIDRQPEDYDVPRLPRDDPSFTEAG